MNGWMINEWKSSYVHFHFFPTFLSHLSMFTEVGFMFFYQVTNNYQELSDISLTIQ